MLIPRKSRYKTVGGLSFFFFTRNKMNYRVVSRSSESRSRGSVISVFLPLMTNESSYVYLIVCNQ